MTIDKRLAYCNKHLATRNMHHASRNKQKGFTLLETLVALAVLAAGAAALSLYLGAFRHISSLEFAHSDSALAAVAYMESQVTALPACADTVHTRRASLTRNPPEISNQPETNIPPEINDNPTTNDKTTIFPEIITTPVPATSLQWLEIRMPDYTFRRLFRCKKASR